MADEETVEVTARELHRATGVLYALRDALIDPYAQSCMSHFQRERAKMLAVESARLIGGVNRLLDSLGFASGDYIGISKMETGPLTGELPAVFSCSKRH